MGLFGLLGVRLGSDRVLFASVIGAARDRVVLAGVNMG